MDDLFSDLRDSEFDDEESPGVTAPMADLPETAPLDFDDEFDQLRDKSARSESTYDEMDTSLDDEFSDSGSGFSFGMFSTSQKLVLLALLMLDLVAVAFGVLLLVGVV